MSNITGTVRAKLQEAKNPKVYNILMPLVNTEYSQALTDGAKQLTIRVREIADLRIAFEPLDTDTKYFSVPRGTSGNISNISYSGSIYFQASKAGCTLEILEWS